jgi:glycosyltransferase involved in cell wall biosynthesis
MRILHVISELGNHGPAAQLAMLGRPTPGAGIDARVCVMGTDGPGAAFLREAGFSVDTLGRRRLFPFASWWRLHHALHSHRPDVIHTWDNASLRAVTLAGGRALARVIASPSAWSKDGSPRQWLDRWLLRGCHRVVTTHRAVKAECLTHGCTPEQVAHVPVATETARCAVAGPLPAGLEEPGAHYIVCAGRLHLHDGFRTALWAFGILCFLYDRLHLVILGDGPERRAVAEFAKKLRGHRRVHLLGDRADAAELMLRADLVWALTADAAQVSLAAMSAARPVLAVERPSLDGIVTAETGLWVPRDEPSLLARCSRDLMEDPARARRLGEAGRLHARVHFPAWKFVDEMLQIYHDAVGERHDLLHAA